MYDHKVDFQASIFLFYCVNFYLYNSYLLGQVFFISDFCKNELRFMPVTIFHLYPITIVDENKKTFFHLWKRRAEYQGTFYQEIAFESWKNSLIFHLIYNFFFKLKQTPLISFATHLNRGINKKKNHVHIVIFHWTGSFLPSKIWRCREASLIFHVRSERRRKRRNSITAYAALRILVSL